MNNEERFNTYTPNLRTDAAKKLANLFPEVIQDGKINFELLKSVISPDLQEINSNERFVFTWRGKENAKRVADLATDETTLIADKESSINWDKTKNVYIEGDNLEVLRLLQKAYNEKVDLIYLDPPYNTGKDFVYHDNFHDSYNNYLMQTGQLDEKGKITTTNRETNGRFHTDWLNMMYPRLKLARKLLSQRGVIFVNLDDTEAFNLKKVMDEIFGEQNFLADIIWNSTKSVTNTAIISGSTTHTLTYFNNMDYFVKNRTDFRIPDNGEGFSNPDSDPRGPWKADPFQVGGERPNQLYEIVNPNTGEKYRPNPGSSWKNEKNKFDELMADNRIVFGKNGTSGPQRKRFLFEAKKRGKVVKTLWDDVQTTTNGTARIKELFGSSVFSNPKPVKLLERIIQLATNSDSIILDFFSGSSTTAEAMFNVNNFDKGRRKFILVQLPENLDLSLEKSNGDNKQSIINAIDYCKKIHQKHELSVIGRERIRLAGKEIRHKGGSDLDLGFRVYKLAKTTINNWDSDPEKFESQLDLFSKSIFRESSNPTDRAREIAIKFGIPLDVDPVMIGENIYHYTSVQNNKELFVVLDGYDENIISQLDLKRDTDFANVVLIELPGGSETKLNIIGDLRQNDDLNNKFKLEWL